MTTVELDGIVEINIKQTKRDRNPKPNNNNANDESFLSKIERALNKKPNDFHKVIQSNLRPLPTGMVRWACSTDRCAHAQM